MSKSYKVNGDLIKSSGQKLKTVGYLIIGNTGVFILYLLFISNSSRLSEIRTAAGILTAIISVIIAFLIIMNIIDSGEFLIKSIEKEELEKSVIESKIHFDKPPKLNPENISTTKQLSDYVVHFIDELKNGDLSFIEDIPPIRLAIFSNISATTSNGKFLIYFKFTEHKTSDGRRKLEGITEIIHYDEEGIGKKIYES